MKHIEAAVDAPPSSSGEAGQEAVVRHSRYAPFWAPSNEADAKRQIFTTDNDEDWRRGALLDFDRIRPYFDSSSTVLDLGCGIGRIASLVAPECRELIAVDVSPQMLVMAAERLSAYNNVKYVACEDVRFPDVPSESVDFAYCLLTLQHVEREDAFLLLEELRRVIRPTGVVALTFPNLMHDFYLKGFLDYAHGGEVARPERARIYTPQEVRRLMHAAGFRCRLNSATPEIRVIGNPVQLESRFLEPILTFDLQVSKAAIRHRLARLARGGLRKFRDLAR